MFGVITVNFPAFPAAINGYTVLLTVSAIAAHAAKLTILFLFAI